MQPKSFADMQCSIAQALEVIGDRWTLLILRDALRGTTRFNDFHTSLGVARNVLTDRLDMLVRENVFTKVKYHDRPVRYEYRLTPKGEDAFSVVTALLNWGDRWSKFAGGPPVVMRHKDCDHVATPMFVCGHCHEPVEASTLATEPGPAWLEASRGPVP